jgi:hypothetical protein
VVGKWDGAILEPAVVVSDGREFSPKFSGVFFREFAKLYETAGFALEVSKVTEGKVLKSWGPEEMLAQARQQGATVKFEKRMRNGKEKTVLSTADTLGKKVAFTLSSAAISPLKSYAVIREYDTALPEGSRATSALQATNVFRFSAQVGRTRVLRPKEMPLFPETIHKNLHLWVGRDSQNRPIDEVLTTLEPARSGRKSEIESHGWRYSNSDSPFPISCAIEGINSLERVTLLELNVDLPHENPVSR